MPGVPAWGAVAIAVGATFLGVAIDAARGSELTSAFASFYIVGTVAAVVLVRYRGLFTAMVQAPLILFVAVPLSYQFMIENAGTSLRDILLNVAIPLVNRFPLMLLGTVLALAVGGARIFLKKQASHAPAGAAKRTIRDRAQETRQRARDNRQTAQDNRRAAQDSRRTSRDGGQRTQTRAAERRGADTRAAHGRGEAVTATRADAGEGRRSRRERVDPLLDRPAADPYRPARTEQPAADPARRPVPRSQPPRVPRPPEVDPYSAPRAATPRPTPTPRPASQGGAHIPPHPVPQVRYRDRGDA